jgi:hypothetical protein
MKLRTVYICITWFISERPTQVSAPLNTSAAHAQQQHVMSQQHQALRLYTEGSIQLAISDIQSNQVKSLRRAEAIYSVSQRTIQRRRDGKRPQRNCEPKSKRLTKLEEEAIVQRILEESCQI